MMKRLLIGVGCFAAVVVLAGIGVSHNQQRVRDRDFTQQNLLPIASWVEAFRSSNERLPTESEFREWADKKYENKLVDFYSKQPAFMNTWGVAGHDFLIGMWQGDWIHYYRSWDGKDFAQ